MGVAVVENIPFSANTLDTAVIGTRGVQPVPIFAAFIAHIAIGNDGSAVGKVSVRVSACGITKLMALDRGINEILGAPELPD